MVDQVHMTCGWNLATYSIDEYYLDQGDCFVCASAIMVCILPYCLLLTTLLLVDIINYLTGC